MLIAGNFAPGNAGVPFYMDIICPVLAIALLVIAKRQSVMQKSFDRQTAPRSQRDTTTDMC